MYINTKKELLDYVKQETLKIQKVKVEVFATGHISDHFNISRNLASQYLNELVKEHELIKVASRPVYFFHRNALETMYHVKFLENTFLSLKELFFKLEEDGKELKNFEKLIGYNSGLSYEVEQCKAAIDYPPSGLPLLFYGQPGTGKHYLAKLIYEYALDNHMIQKTEQNLFQFRCSEFRDNPLKAEKLLFGGPHGEGYLKKAENGILFLSDVNELPMEVLEKLFYYMDNGILASVKLVFSVNKILEENELKIFLKHIPICIKLPSLSERSVEEREQLMIHFFREESRRIQKEIKISGRVFEAFLNYQFPENINELKKYVKISCANAFLDRNMEEELQVYLYHLPGILIEMIHPQKNNLDEQNNLINVNQFENSSAREKVLSYYQEILREYAAYSSRDMKMSDLYTRLNRISDLYIDYLVFEKKSYNNKISAMEHVLNHIFALIAEQYHIHISVNTGFVFAKSLYLQLQNSYEMKLWQEQHFNEIKNCSEILSRSLPRESSITNEICLLMEQNLDMKLNEMNRILLLLNIKQYSSDIELDTIRGIIICHGYSTASSIADTANRILGKRLFDAFDMPLNTPVEAIVNTLKKYMKHLPGPRDIVLLVDMGSLEEIDSFIRPQVEGFLGIINNVSVRLAIDIGSRIYLKEPIEFILKEASEGCISNYRIITRCEKPAAILFVSEGGVMVARRMAELFSGSVSKTVSIEFLTGDYLQLVHEKLSVDIFKNYEVLFITGTVNPEIEGIPFISMEEMISFKEINKINRVLSRYMEEGEIVQFNDNLLKNFSLQNVVQYLTILNPDKVLELVGVSLSRLQQMLHRKFSAKTIVGLNIHISCLIERLVTKTPIQTYRNMEEFEKGSSEIIFMIRQAFKNISDHYGVVFPIEEIAYINEYITNDGQEDNDID